MTAIGVFSDVHGDLHALRDALAQIERLGIERLMCCGDLVDYGLYPDETLALLGEKQVLCIRGNHDRWAAGSRRGMFGERLSERSLAFLDELPTHWRKRIDGVRIVLAHARAESDMQGIDPEGSDAELHELLDEAGADVLIVGHTHVPFVRTLPDGRIVANPGALLRDPGPGLDLITPGTFGIVRTTETGATFEIRRARDGELAELAGSHPRVRHRGRWR
jgi:putative phosphoesterase